MATRDLVRLVLGNLQRMKLRVVMTAIGVVIGTAAVVVLISLAAGLQQSAARDLGSIGDLTEITVFSPRYIRTMGPSGQSEQEAVLNDRALDEFRNLPGVIAVTPKEPLMGSGVLRLNRLEGYAQIVGIDPREIERLGFELASGTDRTGRWQALVGARVADEFHDPRTGRPATDPPDLQGQSLLLVLNRVAEDGNTVERVMRLRVAGVLEESGQQDDYTLFLSLNDVVELNGWFAGQRPNPDRDGYSEVMVKAESPDQVAQVEREIMSRGFYAYSARSMLQGLNTFFLILQGILGGIGAIALIVAAFGIANTMTMAIYERTREIGLMKAVGATNRDVMSVFLAEAGSIGILGGIGGVLLGAALGALIELVAGAYIAAEAIEQAGAAAADTSFTLVHTPPWLPAFAILFSALVGVVSGIYPAMRAASLSPVTALKTE